ncbi:hypothetical protein AADZ86_04525 [Colwelliaceae bacterium BS250]
MNKIILMTISLLIFSSNAIACGAHVDFSIPHVHNEQELLDSIKNIKHSELKQIDIYQVLEGKLENNQDKIAMIDKDDKSANLVDKAN